MKLVINRCFGGFSLSRAAVKRLAELQGRPCFFFTNGNGDDFETYFPSEDASDGRDLFWTAFDIPNPNEVVKDDNDAYELHQLDSRPEDRADPLLIRVVEELCEKADGRCAKLGIVEIPDGVDWEIDEYDGSESVHEKHRSWS